MPPQQQDFQIRVQYDTLAYVNYWQDPNCVIQVFDDFTNFSEPECIGEVTFDAECGGLPWLAQPNSLYFPGFSADCFRDHNVAITYLSNLWIQKYLIPKGLYGGQKNGLTFRPKPS